MCVCVGLAIGLTERTDRGLTRVELCVHALTIILFSFRAAEIFAAEMSLCVALLAGVRICRLCR